MLTICFLNLKGGVGKTSTVFHLSGELALQGYRVLGVDADPQSSLTQGFVGPNATWALDPSETIAAVFRSEGDCDPAAVVRPSGVRGVDLLAGSTALRNLNALESAGFGPRQWSLRTFLAGAGGYDFALVDCPPTLELFSRAAMLASDAVVVPVQPEDFGSQGLAPVGEAFGDARAANPGLALAGYLLTMVDRRLAVHQAYSETLRDQHGRSVFDAAVPLAKDFKEAVALRKPVVAYRPRSAAALSVRAVAAELLDRVSEPARGRGAA